MTFIEFIGFIITMLAFFFLMLKQARDERKRRQNPELDEEEKRREQAAVRDLLKSLNIEVSEDVSEDILPPSSFETEIPLAPNEEQGFAKFEPLQKKAFKDPYASFKSFDYQKAYLKKKKRQPHIKKLLKETHSLKDAVVLKEILGKPKGLL